MMSTKSGWVLQELRQVATLQRGFDLPSWQRRSGKIPIVSSAGVLDYHNVAAVDGPGVVTGRYGTIGSVYFVPGPFWPLNTTLYVKDFHGNDPRFVAYLLETIDFASHSGKSGVPGVNRNDLHRLLVAIPKDIVEQETIAEALTDVDESVDSLDALIAKKRFVKQAVGVSLLVGQKRLDGFIEPWESHSLGDLLDYEQPTKYLVSSTEYVDAGIPVLTAGKTFVLGYTHEAHGIYRNHPVIIFDDFTTASKFVDFAFKAKSSAMKMLTLRNAAMSLRYLYERMQLIDFPFGDHKRYWISDYSKIRVSIPEPVEQHAIAEILADFDTDIDTLIARRDKTLAVKRGMAEELLAGSTRLV
jgi:type I restriction enzyme S subunit